jgi:hypothetical protein
MALLPMMISYLQFFELINGLIFGQSVIFGCVSMICPLGSKAGSRELSTK